jgi:hypothetical protein
MSKMGLHDPCHKNYLHEKYMFKIFIDVEQNIFKKIPSYSHEHVHLLLSLWLNVPIDFKLAIETSKH